MRAEIDTDAPAPAVRRPRGRPPGTGLDDSVMLASIKSCMRQTKLRATPAIRRLGELNPSTIRRLRDKIRDGKKR